MSTTEVLPGTVLERLRVGDRVVALAVRRSGGDGESDRRSAWREWVREKSWSELQTLTGVPNLERLTVTRRGVSGRVVELVAVGAVRPGGGFHARRGGADCAAMMGVREKEFADHPHGLSSPDIK